MKSLSLDFNEHNDITSENQHKCITADKEAILPLDD